MAESIKLGGLGRRLTLVRDPFSLSGCQTMLLWSRHISSGLYYTVWIADTEVEKMQKEERERERDRERERERKRGGKRERRWVKEMGSSFRFSQSPCHLDLYLNLREVVVRQPPGLRRSPVLHIPPLGTATVRWAVTVARRGYLCRDSAACGETRFGSVG